MTRTSSPHDRLRAVVPRPVGVEERTGTVVFDRSSTVSITGLGANDVDRLMRNLQRLPVRLVEGSGAVIEISVDPRLAGEGYTLDVTDTHIAVVGGSVDGCSYAIATLFQLLPPDALRTVPLPGVVLEVPCCRITDAPMLQWRGAMLDVCRHFFPKRSVLRLIDVLALHRINRFQFHLTDDQGWRMESQRFPRLHEVGSWRTESQIGHYRDERRRDGTPHGGFYTRADLLEIVAYAADRGITVVPEIELPGHTGALLAAYPQHGIGVAEGRPVITDWGIHESLVSPLPETMEFLCAVLDEVAEIFPGQWVHVGGDESLIEHWASDERVVALAGSLGFDGVRPLFPRFMAQLGDHLASLGRTMITWDDSFAADPSGAPDGVVMAWRGTEVARRAAGLGHPVVLAPVVPVYFDYYQDDDDREPLSIGGPLTLDDVAGFAPIPSTWSAQEQAHILGAQCQLWTEFVPDDRAVDYMFFPRACAFSEVAWTGRAADPSEFRERLPLHLERLDALGVEYRPLDGPHPWQAGGTGDRKHRRDGRMKERAARLDNAAATGVVAFAPPPKPTQPSS